MKKEDIIKLNTYARHLRDIADKDYISARNLYQLGLMDNFLWFSLQALEKYLKAILLFNESSIKEFSHNTRGIYEKINKKCQIDFSLEDKEEAFLFNLEYGSDRYDSGDKRVKSEDLLLLDCVVWKIRRYCQYVDIESNGVSIKLCFMKNIGRQYYLDNPHKFKVVGGYLESLIDCKLDKRLNVARNLQFKALIYQNFKYGKRKKNIIKNFRSTQYTKCRAPVIDRDTEGFLKKYIRMQK